MVFLIIVAFACVPLVAAVAYTTAEGLALVSLSIATVNSRLMRFFAFAATLMAIVAIAVPLTMFIVPRLPDFRTVGDGGVGMAYNLICKVATILMVPASTCLLAGLLLTSICSIWQQDDPG